MKSCAMRYQISLITSPASKTIRDLDYTPDDDYKAQFRAIVDWYKKDQAERPAVDTQDLKP